MDFVNAIILLLNYIFVPALAYGSQLALGAIFVTLIYGILDLQILQLETWCLLVQWLQFYLPGTSNHLE